MTYTTGERLLHVDHVSLSYEGRPVLKDVEASIYDIIRPDVEQGQVVCFLGASGVGKTRLSRIIAGLDQPSSGMVTGGDNNRPIALGSVGMVPQNYPLFDFARVRDTFAIATAQSSNPSESASRLPQLVEELGLNKYLDFYQCQLSGGTRQRVAIVEALLCAGHTVILDEPFSGLDLRMKERTCKIISKVAAMHSKNTFIIVTHDVTEGMSVADTVWLMGVDKDSQGVAIPGARITDEYNLAKLGLAWQPDILTNPDFIQLVHQVKSRFLEVCP